MQEYFSEPFIKFGWDANTLVIIASPDCAYSLICPVITFVRDAIVINKTV